MLGKILKYDLIYFMRKLFPIYIPLLIASPAVHWIFTEMPEIENTSLGFIITATLFVFSAGLYFVLFALSMLTVYILWQRFSKIMNTTDGYIVHTLPVSEHYILISQYINSLIWIFVSFLVFGLSISMLQFGILNLHSGLGTFISGMLSAISALAESNIFIPLIFGSIEITTTNITTLTYLLPISGILMLISTLSALYGSVCIGQLFPKRKVIGGVIVFFVITVLISISNGIMSFFITANSLKFNITSPFTALIAVSILSIAMSLIVTFAMYFIMYYIIKNRLNIN